MASTRGSFQVHDQYGELWLIKPGDPAHALCTGFGPHYRNQAVLPQDAIATGCISKDTLERTEARIQRLGRYQDPELEKALVLAVQCYQCLKALLGGAEGEAIV